MNIKVALAGNPNCGKTTLFNELTGSNQYVGNWAGVTVDKKSGYMNYEGNDIEIVDLPGIYSLSPYTIEEIVSRNFMVEEKPDVILNIIDATNLERNMYLTLQLMELNIPVVMAVNMIDELKSKKTTIDYKRLSKELGVIVVPISAKKKTNIDLLKIEIVNAAHKNVEYKIKYENIIQNHIDRVKNEILTHTNVNHKFTEYFATKLLEADINVLNKLNLNNDDRHLLEEIIISLEKTSKYGDRETIIADGRYKYIEEVVCRCVKKELPDGHLSLSDKIDRVVTNKILAIPIFFGIMYVMFSLAFGPVGEFFNGIMETLIDGYLVSGVDRILTIAEAPQWIYSLIVDAVIGGVGGVLSFLPQIAILFLCISILEDSGYMARAAFIMDRFLTRLGLNGKAFIPMIMGFGCSVPAVMATRTMENEKERKLAIMIIPFMSCGARLPVYALFAGTFFPDNTGFVIFSLYVLGMLVAIASGLLLKNTLFKDNNATFVLELPPYRFPGFKTVLKHMWEKCKDFIVKAGTLIFSMTVIIWLLQNFDFRLNMVEDSAQSILGSFGTFIAPIFTPLGFGTWQASVSLLTGIIAKEAVVSTMTVLYGAAAEASLGTILSTVFTPASAYAFMVFTLLYVPCVAAFSAIKREMGSFKWAIGTAAFQTTVAYLMSFVFYNILRVII